MKRLIYIANIRLPTEKAHGIQIMEMCKAFSEEGFSVELLVPRRKNFIKEDPFVYHDIEKVFSIQRLPCFDFVSWGKIGFWVELLTFAESAAWYSFFKKDTLFYTRDELIALYLKFMGKNVVWEGHTGQRNFAVRLLVKLKVPIVVITQALKDLYVSMGFLPSGILVAPDGADINRFNIPISKTEARKTFNLPQDKKIALYKGHLYERKGAHTLAEAAKYLEDNILCVFIGGTEEDVKIFKEKYSNQKNVLILGNRPRRETPIYQKASDVLIIPNSAKDDVSKLYTSPMKLFGYMASGVPIIASDLPSLREIIDDSLVYFFRPDDPKNLAEVIQRALHNYEEAKVKGKRVIALAQSYSWQKRAESILNFVAI